MRRALLLAGLILTVVTGATAILVGRVDVDPRSARYVGSPRCAACHAKETLAWVGSDHDRAMDLASDATVLGHFDGSTLEHDGVVSRMFRDGARFMVTTDGKDGTLADFEVSYVFGVRPLQQYLVRFPDGRVQCLPIAWDTDRKRWFHMYPDEHLPAGDSLHWTGPNQNWNWMCADCHSTDLQRGYDPRHDRYDTRWSEIDVGCEGCHGPASEHVRWAESGFLGRIGVGNTGLCTELGPQSGQIELCARCHSRRGPIAATSPPGVPFHDVYRLELLRDGLYEADGTIRDEVYVTGSFLQSRMYHEGVRCSDCHDPHSGKRHAEGNALCVRCHDRTRYDATAHHHHSDGSTGAQCVACHMPQRTYMQVDARRDHSFRVPRPDLSVAHGTPNACTDCHRERDSIWARSATAEWRGGAAPYESPFTRQSKWTAAFSAARHGLPSAAGLLADVVRDRDQPAIVRASALEALGGVEGSEIGIGADVVATAAADPDPLVRAAATSATVHMGDAERLELLLPLLSDRVLRVRIDAAQALATIPSGEIPAAARTIVDRGIDELEVSLSVASDRPEAVLTLGALREERGDLHGAEEHYRRALQLQADFVPALLNLSVLLDRLDRGQEALPLLERAVAAQPEFGPARYSLALALAAQGGREADALAQLERAVALMPRHGRATYNLGLLRLRCGDPEGARAALLRARELLPGDPDVDAAIASLPR